MTTRHGQCRLIENDGRLDGLLGANGLEGLRPLFELESLVDNTLNLDLARVEVVNGSRELVSLREGAQDGDLVADCAFVSRYPGNKNTKMTYRSWTATRRRGPCWHTRRIRRAYRRGERS